MNYVLAETYCKYLSGRQDSNLRPSATKALNNPSRALCLQAMTKYVRGIAGFEMTNSDVFVGDLLAICWLSVGNLKKQENQFPIKPLLLISTLNIFS